MTPKEIADTLFDICELHGFRMPRVETGVHKFHTGTYYVTSIWPGKHLTGWALGVQDFGSTESLEHSAREAVKRLNWDWPED